MDYKKVSFLGIKYFCALFLLFFLMGCQKDNSEQTLEIGMAFETMEDVEAKTGDTEPGEMDADETTMLSEEENTKVFVHVCGSVEKPGLYELSKDSRVAAAIAMAGGFSEDANEDYLNLAQKIEDGMKLYVPSVDENLVMTQQEETGPKKVNINQADLGELCTLSGIGESRAKDIISYRKEHGNFEKAEDIMKVPGIKESVFLKIRESIVADE